MFDLNFKIIGLFIVLIYFSFGQTSKLKYSTNGELSFGINLINYVEENSNSHQSFFYYYPKLNISKKLNKEIFVDFEYSLFLSKVHKEYNKYDDFLNVRKSNHSLWLRFNSKNKEIRIGLQKIIFGPSHILRSLAWFDNYDFTNPFIKMGGVNSIRFRNFFSNFSYFTSWIIFKQLNQLSYGIRYNYSFDTMDCAFTFHRQSENKENNILQTYLAIKYPHNKYAFDLRYDGYVGLWLESVLLGFKNKILPYGTIGIDYTFNVLDGIYVLTETMITDVKNKQVYSAFLLSKQISYIHNISFTSQIDWNNKMILNYFQWDMNFDSYALKYSFALIPNNFTLINHKKTYFSNFEIDHKIIISFNY